jgi:hypothetical protein
VADLRKLVKTVRSNPLIVWMAFAVTLAFVMLLLALLSTL